MLRVSIVGTGYVGLVTGACLSEIGHDVTCVDKDSSKVDHLRLGNVLIHEPGLSELVQTNVRRGTLRFTTQIEEAADHNIDVLFIAVGTPSERGGGANLDFVYTAVEEAARCLAKRCLRPGDFTVVVTKSTVPAGTSWKVAEIVGRHLPAGRFAVASNPEFLREGNGIGDFMEPDRIVIGSESERARAILEDLYLPLVRKGRRLLVTSKMETAELIKYAANAMLATKVAFINELARLCEAIGADVNELAMGVGLDRRIGTEFFSAGPGFGGSCFPKDLRALIKTASDFESPVEIPETVLRANDRHMAFMARKIRDAVGGSLQGKRLGILGLAFKANTDDMRDAPALTIVPRLIADGAEVKGFDPAARVAAAKLIPGLQLVQSVEEALFAVDAAVILTEWKEFKSLSWLTLVPAMRQRIIIDLRNLLELGDLSECGIDYVPLGRPAFEKSKRVLQSE